MLIFDAKVLPAPRELPASAYLTKKYLIDFMVDTRTLSSVPLPDGGHHFNLEFHAVAFASDGTLADHSGTQLNTWASRASYEGIREQGLLFHTSLQLRPGRYQVRLVVCDVRTGYLGSVDVPLGHRRRADAELGHARRAAQDIGRPLASHLSFQTELLTVRGHLRWLPPPSPGTLQRSCSPRKSQRYRCCHQ